MCANVGAVAAWEAMSADDRERTSPATMLQMFLLWKHQVATMDRRSFGRIGSDGQHYLRFSIATAMDDLKIGLDRIRTAAADRAGFEAFVREGQHLW